MHCRRITPGLSPTFLIALLFGATCSEALAQCNVPGLSIVVHGETVRRTVLSDEEMIVTLKTTNGARVQKVVVQANTRTAITLTNLPPPRANGDLELRWKYIVSADTRNTIRLEPGRNLIRVQAWDDQSRCAIEDDVAVDALSAETFAVLVGINHYAATTESLKYAKRDAEKMAEHLMTHRGVPRSNITLLTDKWEGPEPDPWEGRRDEPTWEYILVALSRLAEMADKRGMIVFYFSGHGYAPPKDKTRFDQSHYLLTQDATLQYDTRMLSFGRIVDKLVNIEATRKIVILDACFSSQVVVAQSSLGGNLRAKTLGRAASNDGLARLLARDGDQKVYLMNSSTNDQLSYEFDGIDQSIFTYHLLRSAKDPDTLMKDATLHDAFKYAEDELKGQVPLLTDGKEQVPNKWIAGDIDDIPWRRRPNPARTSQ